MNKGYQRETKTSRLVRLLLLLGFVIPFTATSNKAVATAGPVQVLQLAPEDLNRSRIVPVKIYYRPSSKPQPVILFSHGLGGSRENNSYLGRYWAERGFISVFMQHHGSDETVWKPLPRGERLAALKAAASIVNFIHRIRDVSFLIDKIEVWNEENNHPLHGLLNLTRIGMSGYSFGAVTTLTAAGRKFRKGRHFSDGRIRAFIALSPNSSRRLSNKESFGDLARPILLITGTKDVSLINPFADPAERLQVFRALPPGNKYQLVLKGATHSAFGDTNYRKHNRNPSHHPAIQKITLKFWQAHLKDKATAKSWLTSDAPIKETGLGPADLWQWKD